MRFISYVKVFQGNYEHKESYLLSAPNLKEAKILGEVVAKDWYGNGSEIPDDPDGIYEQDNGDIITASGPMKRISERTYQQLLNETFLHDIGSKYRPLKEGE